MRGFTLIEILLVIAIIGLLAFLSIPVGLEFYRSQLLDTTADGLVQTLARARSKAMSGELDSSYGIYIEPDKYIIYKGQDYALRDASYDEVFKTEGNILLSGIQQINFEKISALPSISGNIIIDNNKEILVVNINQMGLISLKSATQEIITLRPNASGSECLLNSQKECLACPGHYQCAYEEITNDNNYASNWQSTSWLRDLYNIQNYSGSGSINYIEVNYRVLGGIFAWQYYGWAAASIRINNQTFDGQEIDLSTYGSGQGLPYLNLVYRWDKNPAIGLDWTWTDINNLQIGAKLKSVGANYYVALSQIYVKVSYLNF